jgi:predicted  nucleic acid-binding Zn-ribbon protein
MDYDEIQSWLQQVSDDVDYAVGKVTTLEDATDTTVRDISDLTADVYALQEQVASLSREVVDLANAIQTIVARLDDLARRPTFDPAWTTIYGN